MTWGDLAWNVDDESRKRVFDSGMDVRKSSYKSDTASELLRGFTHLWLTLCCDIANPSQASCPNLLKSQLISVLIPERNEICICKIWFA